MIHLLWSYHKLIFIYDWYHENVRHTKTVTSPKLTADDLKLISISQNVEIIHFICLFFNQEIFSFQLIALLELNATYLQLSLAALFISLSWFSYARIDVPLGYCDLTRFSCFDISTEYHRESKSAKHVMNLQQHNWVIRD